MAVKYTAEQKKIKKIYAKAIKQIHDFLISELSVENQKDGRTIDQAAIYAQLHKIMVGLNEETKKQLIEAMVKEFTDETLRFHEEIGNGSATEDVDTFLDYAFLTKVTIDIYSKNTMDDLIVATKHMDSRLKRIVQETVSKHVQLGIAVDMGWDEIAKSLYKDLSKQGLSEKLLEDGFVGIVDSLGRRWKLSTYVDMVITTSLKDASVAAHKAEGLRENVDLAIISTHGARDACSKWEGTIISMNGLTEGYITYDQVKETRECFHPNCQHHLQPVRDLSLVHKDILDKHMQNKKDNWDSIKKL